GSCFPTTIYIGHPGWKGLGARAGYSTLNGIVITILCLTGTVGIVNAVIPIEAGVAIVLWIGIIITAQAFAATPKEHAPAVAVGLFPAIAAWGFNVVQGAFFFAGGKTIQELLTASPTTELNGYLLQGMISIERGYIFTCMMLAAISAFLIDRKFFTAGIWAIFAGAFAAIGLTHAFIVKGNIVDFLFVQAAIPSETLAYRAWDVAVGYGLIALAFFAFGIYHRGQSDAPRLEH
ncbi:MAG: permease, partial [Planctomycetales bacterium 12-60-4]